MEYADRASADVPTTRRVMVPGDWPAQLREHGGECECREDGEGDDVSQHGARYHLEKSSKRSPGPVGTGPGVDLGAPVVGLRAVRASDIGASRGKAGMGPVTLAIGSFNSIRRRTSAR